MSKTAPYRIELRIVADGIETLLQALDGFRGDQITRETGWAFIQRRIAEKPLDYAPHGDFRLVLLGPDRTVLPAAVTEGPGL